MKLIQVAEIQADDFFKTDEAVDLKYCVQYASFKHENSCEFMVYLQPEETAECFEQYLAKMVEFGCTESFMSAVRSAREAGAVWAMFYV